MRGGCPPSRATTVIGKNYVGAASPLREKGGDGGWHLCFRLSVFFRPPPPAPVAVLPAPIAKVVFTHIYTLRKCKIYQIKETVRTSHRREEYMRTTVARANARIEIELFRVPEFFYGTLLASREHLLPIIADTRRAVISRL